MNARQKCKKLKQRNRLLMNIVNRNPDYLLAFDFWTRQPFKIVHTMENVQLKTYAARVALEPAFRDHARAFAEDCVVRKLSEAIKNNVEWRFDVSSSACVGILEGRIMIGRKGGRVNDTGRNYR